MSDEINWLDRYFVSAFTIDENGIANLDAVETATTGDTRVTIRGKYASVATTDATVTEIALPWAIASGSAWAFEIYVTCKGTGVRRRIKLSAVVWGNGANATLDGAVDNDTKGTGAPTATIFVNGSSAYLRLTPGAAAAFTWGFEIRAQQL